MADFDEIEFVIPAYAPETMPFDRLLQYLQHIGDVIGVPHEMHLVRIEESSTKPVFKLPIPVANLARERVAAVRAGGGTATQRRALDQIRQMVRRDAGRDGKSAHLNDRTGVILDIPPAPEEMGVITGVRQVGSFDGALTKVGGVGEFIPIQMQSLSGDVCSGFHAPKSLAKAMAQLLFEPIRVTGIGSWERTTAGEWKLSKMLVQTYEPLEDESLSGFLQKLRAAPVVWPANADELLRAEREAVL